MRSLLIVEDDRLLREVLVDDVSSSAPNWSVLSADSLANARRILRGQALDALFVDLGLPDGDGRDLIRECRALHPSSDILVITVFADEDRVIDSLEAGASGYLLKTDLPHYAGRLVATIAAGGSPVSPTIARRLIDRMRSAPRPAAPGAAGIEPLSPREVEILSLCERGLRYSEIAEILGVSVHTVNAHLKNVYRKLSVNSRAEAVFQARRTGQIHD